MIPKRRPLPLFVVAALVGMASMGMDLPLPRRREPLEPEPPDPEPEPEARRGLVPGRKLDGGCPDEAPAEPADPELDPFWPYQRIAIDPERIAEHGRKLRAYEDSLRARVIEPLRVPRRLLEDTPRGEATLPVKGSRKPSRAERKRQKARRS